MRIVIAAAEVAPFARVGGLSDVAGALSKEIAARGHEVSVFLPKYAAIDEERYALEPVSGAGPLDVPMGDGRERCRLFRGSMPGADAVAVYFVEHPGFFEREGIYVDPETGHGYPDEVERYALFGRAVLESILALELEPDCIHLNDHHTALVLAYLREVYGDNAVLQRAGTVFSIHNLGYQGPFDPSLLPRLGLPESLAEPGGPYEFHGMVNNMKVGIELADYVNTVSRRYAEEISSLPEYGLGLEDVLGERRKNGRLVGILNGVDYSVWDPSVDDLIPARYGPGDLAGKHRCKAALLERAGLPPDGKTPLIGIVSRLADQKGFDLLREVGDDIPALGAGLVVLGTGQPEYHTFLEELAKRHPERVSANLTFNNEFAHWIEAGSDMFLMPSRYEPCGLNQMYSLRYGTVPVVRETGGLADTVADYDPATDEGTGFVFQEYDAAAMLDAIRRAVETYADAAVWSRIVERGMAADFGWAVSAERYEELYGRAKEAAGTR
ncbi:MAG: glycosyltransferase [Candidatus Eisenbacteria bacterium]|nr:glycosyltransferase [Candidatus Eisenbacteria bacterium]